jgi:hypothetical protein
MSGAGLLGLSFSLVYILSITYRFLFRIHFILFHFSYLDYGHFLGLTVHIYIVSSVPTSLSRLNVPTESKLSYLYSFLPFTYFTCTYSYLQQVCT